MAINGLTLTRQRYQEVLVKKSLQQFLRQFFPMNKKDAEILWSL